MFLPVENIKTEQRNFALIKSSKGYLVIFVELIERIVVFLLMV